MTKYTLLTATCRRTPDAITLAIGNLVHRAASKSALPAVRLEQRSDFGKAEPKPVRRGHSYLERLDQAYFASLPLRATRLLHDRRHFRFPGACYVGRRWRSFRSARCGAACIFGSQLITRCAVAA